ARAGGWEVRRARRPKERGDPAAAPLDRLYRKLLLSARKVVVDRSPRRSTLSDDVHQADAVIATPLEQPRRCLDHPLTGLAHPRHCRRMLIDLAVIEGYYDGRHR